MFLYCTVSTLNPIVGIVWTTSPICSRYRIVVFPLTGPPPLSQHEPRPSAERPGEGEGEDVRRVEAEHQYSHFRLSREEAREF